VTTAYEPEVRPAVVEHPRVLTERDLADFVWPLRLGGQDRADLAFHARRWVILLAHVDTLVEAARARGGPLRMLDIGPSLQTDVLRHNYPDVPIDTLDLSDDARTLRLQDVHIRYDLNDLYHRERWPQIGPYDVIVMCEVIEHLYTGADTVLAGLASIVKPYGSLFLQTPNAAALHKRIQLAAGRNPCMSLEEDRTHPPHFHEFTVPELAEAARRAGWHVDGVETHNAFSRNNLLSAAYNRVCSVLPGSFRAGISMTLTMPALGEPGLVRR
jgi:Methyltransferase domain